MAGSRFAAAAAAVFVVGAAVGAPADFTTIRNLPAGLSLGGPTALAVGPSGSPVVGVIESVSGDLRLSWYLCDDETCSSGRLAPFATVPLAFTRFSVAVGTDGRAVAAYAFAGSLFVARCNSAACDAPTVSAPIDANVATAGIDVTMWADNSPVVSYMQTNGRVRLAICGDPRCSAPLSQTLFDTGETNQAYFHTAVALTAGDLPRVALASRTMGYQLALCKDAECFQSPSVVALPNIQSGEARGIAMALSSDGTATVAHSSDGLPSFGSLSIGIYQCPNPDCTGTIASHRFLVIDPFGWPAGLPALVVGADSVPLAAFGSGQYGGMHVLHGRPRDFVNSAASVTMLDAQSRPSSMVAMALGPQGRPVLAYLGPEGVRVASCNTRTCQ